MPQVARLGGLSNLLKTLSQAATTLPVWQESAPVGRGARRLESLPGRVPASAPPPAPVLPPPAPPAPKRDRAQVSPAAGAAAVRDGRPRTERFKLQIDLVQNRIYVINKDTGKPIDKFLTSPGTAEHPTVGSKFKVTDIFALPTWYPPKSKWAEGLKPVGPGPDNPIGLLALDLGAYAQLIHGVPKSKYALLGQPASKGCLRMSNENVLLLYHKYIARGIEVDINRDPAKSDLLRAQSAAAGVRDRKIDEGAEFYADALKGKLPPQP